MKYLYITISCLILLSCKEKDTDLKEENDIEENQANHKQRNWKINSKNYKGSLIKYEDNYVFIKLDSGKKVKSKFSNLSQADRDYVQNELGILIEKKQSNQNKVLSKSGVKQEIEKKAVVHSNPVWDWELKSGTVIRASFVKAANGYIYFKRENGKFVKAKVSNLTQRSLLAAQISHNLRDLGKEKPEKPKYVPPKAIEYTKVRPKPSWMYKPYSQWPQILLTNKAQFSGNRALNGASSFLIKNSKGVVVLATAKHLLGPAGGVKPELNPILLNKEMKRWIVFPRTRSTGVIQVHGVSQHRDYRLHLSNFNQDVLILDIKKPKKFYSLPLDVSRKIPKVGDKVYLLGVPYTEKKSQNVYQGKITQVSGDFFRYSIKPHADIRGFSGAPILDSNGYAIGVMTVWFDAKIQSGKYTEAGAQSFNRFFKDIESRTEK